MRGAAAGAIAAAVWAAGEPVLQRLVRTPYSDVRLLGRLATRARGWPVAGVVLHVANGAVFGAAFERAGLRGMKAGVLAAEAENAALWPALALVDRVHPDRRTAPGRRSLAARGSPCTSSWPTRSSAPCWARSFGDDARGRPLHARPARARPGCPQRCGGSLCRGSYRCSSSTRLFAVHPPTASCARRSQTCAAPAQARRRSRRAGGRPGRRDLAGRARDRFDRRLSRRRRECVCAGPPGSARACDRGASGEHGRGGRARRARARRPGPLPRLHALLATLARGAAWDPRPSSASRRAARHRSRCASARGRGGERGAGSCGAGCAAGWTSTRRDGTISRPPRRRGSVRISTSAASRPPRRSPAPGLKGRSPRSSCGSSAGETSTCSCWRQTRRRRGAISMSGIATGSRTPMRWRRGPRAGAAFRSSMPRCASSRAEGWLPNRARLIAASFLTKTLGIHWRRGSESLLRAPGGRRRREQHRQLAVGRGDRRRHPAEPPFNPVTPGEAIRPRRRLRPPLRPRARKPRGRSGARTVARCAGRRRPSARRGPD